MLKTRNHLARVQHLLDLRRTLEIGRKQRTLILQLARQPFNLLLFAPFEIRSQTDESRHRVNRLGVSIALLSDVELDQSHPETLHLTNDVQEVRIGDLRVTDFDQRFVTRDQRFREFLLVTHDARVGDVDGQVAIRHALSQNGARVVELVSKFSQDDAIGFVLGNRLPEIIVISSLAFLEDGRLIRLGGGENLLGARLDGVVGAPHGEIED